MLQKCIQKTCSKDSRIKEDLIENEIADKITSAGKTKNKGKEKEDETNEL